MAPLLIQEIRDGYRKVPKTLELSPVETTLRQLLLDVAKYIDQGRFTSTADAEAALPPDLAQEPVTLRFTGGWVRDKLLGVASHDIDVAINKMTGYKFGLRLKEYLEVPGNAEKYGLDGVATTDKQSLSAGSNRKSKVVGGLHKIEANPEKSKHLETVTTKILGLDIDLVNLRKETYTEESRTPQMEFGSPEEDAMRRDATVNAMFFNLNTKEIEDLTGKGHDDMRDKIIRTPLEPHQTFKDDPLRVLRLIRFASRLGYSIEHGALEAMRDPAIKDALRKKISRERVGIEIEKVLRGEDPFEALRLIFSLDLYETVFSDPSVGTTDHFKPDTSLWEYLIAYTSRFLADEGDLTHPLIMDEEDEFMAWLLTALMPYRDAPQPAATESGRRTPPPTSTVVAKEGIKSTNKVCDIITSAVGNQSEISDLIDRVHEQERKSPGAFLQRDVLGMAIRKWGPSWRNQVMYSLFVESSSNRLESGEIESRYMTFMSCVRRFNFLKVCELKPLVDGTTLAKALGMKPGPWMKTALDVVMAYQLRHPNATVDDAVAQVRRTQQTGGELTTSLVHHFLKLTIRPMFIKAKPSSVTDAGRKNTTEVLPKRIGVASDDESVTRPWKDSRHEYALELLQWCSAKLNRPLLEHVWPLIVPPCLTLVDDWQAQYKVQGAQLLQRVLEATSSPLLARTGLRPVFEDALLACLAYVPPVTPEDESIPLLETVYPALLALARIPPAPSSSRPSAPLPPPRTKLLDDILRKGILFGCTHCAARPRVLTVLLAQLPPLLRALGVHSTKHLPHLLPILTATLAPPVAPPAQHTPVLLTATRALQAVVLNAWPRVSAHRGEVMKGLALGWGRVVAGRGAGDADARALADEMRATVRMLRAALPEEVDFDAELGALVDADPRLEDLVGGEST